MIKEGKKILKGNFIDFDGSFSVIVCCWLILLLLMKDKLFTLLMPPQNLDFLLKPTKRGNYSWRMSKSFTESNSV